MPTLISCFAGSLQSTLELLDASLRATVVDVGLAIEALVAAEVDGLHPASLRLTANEVRRPAAPCHIAARSSQRASLWLKDPNMYLSLCPELM